MPFPVAGHRHRVDRVHLIAGRQQRLHPRPAVGLDPDHDRVRLVVAEMVGDQRVQRGDPGHALGQPAPDQPPPAGVLDLDVVMGLGPVITDEQHRDDSSRLAGRPRSRHREEELRTR